MREVSARRRIVSALLLAVIAGAFVYFANPVKTLKADLRTDTEGFVLSLEYTARLIR